MAKKFTITLPDGTVATRTSANREYVVGIVLTTDPARESAVRYEAAAGYTEKAFSLIDLARGEYSQKVLSTYGNGAYRMGHFFGGRLYIGEYVSSPDSQFARPVSTEAKVRKSLESEIASYVHHANAAYESADRIASSPARYSVVRWSQTLKNAEKALTTKEFDYRRKIATLTIVPVD